MSFQDDEFVLLSELQHDVFCPRQCALQSLEGVWADNALTVGGSLEHAHVHSLSGETRKDVHEATSLALISERLGLRGVSDCVEFHRVSESSEVASVRRACPLAGRAGLWRPIPIEYKHGKPKEHQADEVQLCAQAICLEEMLDVEIPVGYLFYHRIRRRVEVPLTALLQTRVMEAAQAIRAMKSVGKTPPAIYTPACESCSIKEFCQPQHTTVSAQQWLAGQLDQILNV